MQGRWSTQDAKQRLSELLRAAQDEPQLVTKHGEEVAVVMDIGQYRRLAGIEVEVDLKQALADQERLAGEAAAVFDEIVAER